MPSEVAKLFVTVDARTSGFERGLSKVEKQSKSTAKNVDESAKRSSGAWKRAAGVLGAGFAIGGLVKFGKAATDMASDIDESLAKNRVLFGQFAGAVDSFSTTTAQSLGISRAAALEATGTFGNLFTALGIGQEKSAGMSMQLTRLAADMASFNNASPEETLQAIRSGLVGETEPLRRFGVNLNDATLRAEALRQGLIKTTKDALTPQQKALAVNALLFRQTAAAQGDFARTSEGNANQQRILKAQLQDLQAELGQKLLPIQLKVTQSVVGFVKEMKTGKGAGGEFARTMKDIAQATGQVVGVAKDVAKFLKDHPQLLAIAGGAWVAYKVAALAQIGAVRAASLGLFGAGMKKRLAASAASAGASAGKSFAAKAGVLAAAGIAGWEIGKWLRENVPAVKAAGDWLGENLAKAMGSKVKETLNADLQSAVNDATRTLKDALGTAPAVKKIPKGQRPPRLKPLPKGTTAPLRGLKRGGKKANAASIPVKARAAGEAGGAELGSLQSALAWVQKHYPGAYEAMVEAAGTANQHFHLAHPKVVEIGRKLAAMGFAVAENPAFGGVRGRHTPNSWHYRGLAIDVNADYRSIRADGMPAGGGGGGGSSSSGADTAARRAANRKRAAEARRKREAAERRAFSKAMAEARRNQGGALSTARSWDAVSKRLDLVDLQVAAGKLTEAEGRTRKLKILRQAKGWLKGRGRLEADAEIRRIEQEGREAEADARDFAASQPDPHRHLVNDFSPMDRLSSDLARVDAQVRAGDLTPEQGRAKKLGLIDWVLNNRGITGISDDDVLQLRGDKKDIEREVLEATSTNTAAIEALTEEMKKNREFGERVVNTQNDAMARWIANVLSGVQGQNLAGRRLAPSIGTARVA